MPRLHCLALFILLSGSLLLGQARIHPMGLTDRDTFDGVRDRLKTSPYQQMYSRIIESEQQIETNIQSVYDQAEMIRLQAFIYGLSQESAWAQKCYFSIKELSSDTVFIHQPFSFGLTRALLLRNLALAYDYCYEGWSDAQRVFVNTLLFELMCTVHASMGPDANYRLESNWMGVRYGSVLLASVILNDELTSNLGRRGEVLSHLWDSKERLRDHLKAGYTSGGWFVETMGYQYYEGQFVLPAIIAYQNSIAKGVLKFEEYAPGLVNGFRQHITGTVSIRTKQGFVIKPDLANDNVMIGFTHWPLWLRILPDFNRSHIRWMHDYLYQNGHISSAGDLFYSILFYDSNERELNPETGGYLNYIEYTQGVVMFRNQFRDSTDIVATFNTSSKRYGGHSGPDNLTFRLTGMGNIWVVGGGRTGDSTGQTNLFPDKAMVSLSKTLPAGKLNAYKFFGDGSGYAIGSGSCLGVINHTRLVAVDFSEKSGTKGVVVIKDVSDNGRVWRLHTPEFNRVTLEKGGLLLTAPNGSTLKISLPGIKQPVISIGRVRYGGETIRHNPGVEFNGVSYFNNHLIDIECNGAILVVMTLQEPGKEHPVVKGKQHSKHLVVGKKQIKVSTF